MRNRFHCGGIVPHARGFAMLDVLIALLLLAVALTGACATLIHTMRSTHDALLATRAVDLAADLSEELKRLPAAMTPGDAVGAWRERVRVTLPVAGLAPEQFASLAIAGIAGTDEPAADGALHLVTLRWRSARGELEELNLPVVIPLATDAVPPV